MSLAKDINTPTEEELVKKKAVKLVVAHLRKRSLAITWVSSILLVGWMKWKNSCKKKSLMSKNIMQ